MKHLNIGEFVFSLFVFILIGLIYVTGMFVCLFLPAELIWSKEHLKDAGFVPRGIIEKMKFNHRTVVGF